MGGDAVLLHQLEEVLGNLQTDLALTLNAAANTVGAGVKNAVLAGGGILKEQVHDTSGFVQQDGLGFSIIQSFHSWCSSLVSQPSSQTLNRPTFSIIPLGNPKENFFFRKFAKFTKKEHTKAPEKHERMNQDNMELTALQFLIVCPLVFLAGLVDAMAGGGGLISLPAYLISGLPVHYAIGTNKLSSGMGTTLATWRFARSGYIHWKLALFCTMCALVGSTTGARLALLIPDAAFRVIMLVVLPLTGCYLLRGKALDAERPAFSSSKTIAVAMGVAMVIGLYDGFYGPGTGTFLILMLTGLAHLTLASANGIAKVINLTTNLSALVVFFLNGKVLLLLGLVAGCFSILGNYIGTQCFDKGGAKAVKPLMIVVLCIFFIKVLWELIGG